MKLKMDRNSHLFDSIMLNIEQMLINNSSWLPLRLENQKEIRGEADKTNRREK